MPSHFSSVRNSQLHGDRLLFEVVAEGPVAEHFKKCQVACIADFIDITRANAFLDIGKANSRRMRRAIR